MAGAVSREVDSPFVVRITPSAMSEDVEYYGPPPLTKWQRQVLADPDLPRKKREANREWRNRPENAIRRQQYYLANRDHLNGLNKANNRARRAAMTPEELEERRRVDREARTVRRADPVENEKLKAHHKKWREGKKGQEYMLRTIDRRNGLMRERRKDPKWKMVDAIRMRLYIFLKGARMSKRTMEMVGCTPSELKVHLENQFTKGMNWSNHGRGKGKWHVDHIKALATFENIHLPNVQRVAFHWSNLRPLWSTDNVRKGIKQGKPIGQLPLLSLVAA